MISWKCTLVLVCDHPDCREGLKSKIYAGSSPEEAEKLACRDEWFTLSGFHFSSDRHLCGKHKGLGFKPCLNCQGTGELRYSSRSEGYGNTQAPELTSICEPCRGLGWISRIPAEGKTI